MLHLTVSKCVVDSMCLSVCSLTVPQLIKPRLVTPVV